MVYISDQLLYGQIHLPTSKLHALYARRLSPQSQLLISSISHPRKATRNEPSDMYFTYQKDKGHYGTELTYSVADGMASVSSLFHFGLIDAGLMPTQKNQSIPTSNEVANELERRVDEENGVSSGLKGHFSLGGEIYASALEKSAGSKF